MSANRKKVKLDSKHPRKAADFLKQEVQEAIKQSDHILVTFKNSQGHSIGTLDLSLDSTPAQMQQLVNGLLKDLEAEDFEQQEFNFFHQERQIKTKLENFLLSIQYKSETKFEVFYYPVSTYKVLPITRSSASLMGHTDSVICSAFSPDSSMLATGSGDTTVRLWDIQTQTPYKQVEGTNWIMVLAWAPDGSKFAFGDKNGLIKVYREEDDYTVSLKGHTKWIMSISWEPLHLNESCSLFASSSKDATMRIWNADSGVCLRAFGNHLKCVTKVIWGGQGNIYSCSEDQRIVCWNQGGQFKHEFKKHSHWVNTISLSTDFVLRQGCFDNQSSRSFADIKKLKPAEKKALSLELYQKAVKTHKERLVSGSDDHTLMLFTTTCKEPIKVMVGHQQPVSHVQFSPDGRYVLSASFDKALKLWDAYTGDFLFSFKGHVAAVYQLAWSCDSRFLVSASRDSTMKVWDIKSRKLMHELPGHADEVYTVDWSCNGQYVASGGKDKQVKIWRN